MDLVGQIPRGGPSLHQIGVGKDGAVLVRPLVLVLHREDGDVVQKVEDHPVHALLNAGALPLRKELSYILQASLLGLVQVGLAP